MNVYFLLGLKKSGVHLFTKVIISNYKSVLYYDNIELNTKHLIHHVVNNSNSLIDDILLSEKLVPCITRNPECVIVTFFDMSIKHFEFLCKQINKLFKNKINVFQIVIIRDLLNCMSSRLKSNMLVNEKTINLWNEHLMSSYKKFNYNLYILDENYRNNLKSNVYLKNVSLIYSPLFFNTSSPDTPVDYLTRYLKYRDHALMNIDNNCKDLNKSNFRISYRQFRDISINTDLTVCQKIAVVSAIFLIDKDEMDISGDFKKISNWDYILFTNDKTKIKVSQNWDIREIISPFKNGVLATKHVKWLTHKYLPYYDIIIWVDSFISPNNKKEFFFEHIIRNVSMSTPPIIMRTQKFNTVRDDINWCLKNNRINTEISENIIKKLDSMGFSVDETVQTYWSSAIIKCNTNITLQKMAEELFYLLESVGYRDQHWLPYLLKKHNLSCEILEDKDLFEITGAVIKANHNYNNFFKKPTILINNNYDCHYEIVESIIKNISFILKSHQQFIIHLKVKSYKNILNHKSFQKYFKDTYPNINIYSSTRIETEQTFDYRIYCTVYNNDLEQIKKNSKFDFYISHEINDTLINYENVYFLTPLCGIDRFFYCDVLPFANLKRTNSIPIYIIQGNLEKRDIRLLKKILDFYDTSDYEFIIKVLCQNNYDKYFQVQYKKLFFFNNLNFEDFHEQFIDAYCIIPLISYEQNKYYYEDKLTSSINYAKGYNLFCLIDTKLQEIYKLDKVFVYNDLSDINNAFIKSLKASAQK